MRAASMLESDVSAWQAWVYDWITRPSTARKPTRLARSRHIGPARQLP